VRLDCIPVTVEGRHDLRNGDVIRYDSVALYAECSADRVLLTRLARMLQAEGGTAARQLLLLLQRERAEWPPPTRSQAVAE
jgi:hypothetical protein